MTANCTDKRTTWNCKACGSRLGSVSKDSRGWHYLVPSGLIFMRIYGNAEITCQTCGVVREWWWDEVAIGKVFRERPKVPLTADHT